MSRLGKFPITIKEGITIAQEHNIIKVAGVKGEMVLSIPRGIKVIQEDNCLRLERENNSRQMKTSHGLIRQLLANMVTGVSDGFVKKLELKGVGYRVQLVGRDLELHLGFSHLVKYSPPQDIELAVAKNIITVSGVDKQKVGQVAAEIRHLKPPEVYKGKGIRYYGEIVKLKAGKTAKTK
ncbi:MAG: large subunit ribosomal protein L6 [Candidatus Berkelbacteria bacterium Licking1014_2]|uniref:Large ribosomal subunit protein uL6 n=1 Tax=Candidatus Berkelbacteria bacterium Licking1014_2 TaxID=2017146 RepID=A0A554LWX0_9BACT|nr:MAG: large subunit ribosomal protein L6 [Candidatus Berkelbacteria bacterium Licking1014_2]